jgi:hypothetical protein
VWFNISSKNILRETRRELKEAKRKAKCNWQWVYAEKCQQSNFQKKSNLAWKKALKLIEGFQGHHKSFVSKMFKNTKATHPKTSQKI